jgi:protein-disulfide isomerase
LAQITGFVSSRFGRSTLALAVGLSMASLPLPRPAQADDAAQFTPAQRAQIVAIVRNALKTDPSILGDAVVALRASAQRKEDADASSALQANRSSLSGQPGDAILGNPAGNVTVVEFYDPRCPYCRKVLPDLDTLVGTDHKLRLVEKLIPILGPNSMLDAQAIQAAALQGRYGVMQRALMTDASAPGPERVRTLAASAGLDVPRLLRDMKSPEVASVLDRNVELARTLHLTGTPSFVIGNQVIPGAVELADLRQAVATQRDAR